MTWVIGTTSLFGYGALISDVRVTFRDNSERDMLLKVYPIAPFLVCGFAGSVAIGFAMIAAMQKALRVPEDLLKVNWGWHPNIVADGLPILATEVFHRAPEYEQRLGSQLLLVGVSPTENLGDAPFPRVYLIRFSSPDFRAGYMQRGLRACHIGSGRKAKSVRLGLDQYFQFGSTLAINGEDFGPSGRASLIAHVMSELLSESPVQGVSPHLHVMVCERGKIGLGNSNRTMFGRAGEDDVEIKMPPVARNPTEFARMCAQLSCNAAGAVC